MSDRKITQGKIDDQLLQHFAIVVSSNHSGDMKFVTTSSIPLVLSLLGMLYHIYYISYLYFLYKASTEIDIGMPVEMSQPSLTICMFYPNFLNRSQLEKLAKERGQSLNLSKVALELCD